MKIIRLFILAMVIQLVFMPAIRAEVIDTSRDVGVSADVPHVLNLEINLVSIDTGLDLPETSGITFRNVATVSTTDPWRPAEQYIRVRYNSNYALWGVRILTDNVRFLGVQITDPAATTYMAGEKISIISGTPPVTREYYAYSGLIGPGPTATTLTTRSDPSRRAALAWQVYEDPLPVRTYPTVPTVTLTAPDAPRTGLYIRDNGVGSYGSAWTYIYDKTFRNADAGRTDAFDGRIYTGMFGTRRTYNDNLIVFGGPGNGPGTLGSHPVSDRTGDDDRNGIAVYLAARFANTNWGSSDTDIVRPFALPTDRYTTIIYVELVHE